MNIKTRHGYEKPIESDLEDYQLGWSIDEGCLYIKDPSQQGDKVLRVLSDKALLDANQKFIKELQNSLNDFSDAEISKAKEELKKLYEKKTTYVIEFGVPADEDKEDGVDYTVDTEFDYYTKETADEAVASFIEKLNSLNIGNQDPDIKNAGSKIIISKADHSVAYLYMILEDDDGKEYGQLINTLEQSFPSLVLEWSDKKENTIEFKLNNEVLNEINFSNMVVDEGSWNHGEGVKLNPSLDNEYIEYVSPICFHAKKDCYVRPNQYIEYDDDYAYGYQNSANGLEDFKSWTAFDYTTPNNIFSPTKISLKISENAKRNKYYSVFRIKENSIVTSNTWAKNGFGSNTTSNTGSSYSNILLYGGNDVNSSTFASYFYSFNYAYPVEVYDKSIDKWVYMNKAVKKPNHIITPTAEEPIILNYFNTNAIVNVESTSDVTKSRSCVFGYISYPEFDEAVRICKNNSYSSSSVALSSYGKDVSPFYGKNVKFVQTAHLDNDSKMFSTYIKVKSEDFIKVEKGYKYVILEALDANSRAFILPMYKDTKRSHVFNQLIDIEQILYSNPLPGTVYYYKNSSSIYSGTGLSIDSSIKTTDVFESESIYEYGETVTCLRYMVFSDLASGFGNVYRSSNTIIQPNCNCIGGNGDYVTGLSIAAGKVSGFAPNYKYLNVKGLDE